MVPALEPIYFLPLDEEGRAVQRMRTFTHLMPGEKQGCIGCHADRNTITPKNAGFRPKALVRNPQQLTEPEWGVTGFCYSSLVQPVWDKNCIQCHGRNNPAAGLELTGDKTDFFNISYENLVRKGSSAEEFMDGGRYRKFAKSKYTSWISTINGQESNILRITPGEWGAKASLLATIIHEGHSDVDGKARVKLTDLEKKLIYAWLDLNVPYYPTSSSNYEQNRGCRQMIPTGLNEIFTEVAKAKCISCHNQKGMDQIFNYPGNFALRIEHPELNPILMAPLSVSAGGSGKCSAVVFKDKNDPDYRRIMETFKAMQQELAEKPRMDMAFQNGLK
jgi:mono/diheme cytochrome c family protein